MIVANQFIAIKSLSPKTLRTLELAILQLSKFSEADSLMLKPRVKLELISMKVRAQLELSRSTNRAQVGKALY